MKKLLILFYGIVFINQVENTLGNKIKREDFFGALKAPLFSVYSRKTRSPP